MRPPRLHALLIGIDAYPRRPLRGAVADVEAVREFLTQRASVPAEDVRCLVGRWFPDDGDVMPTREAILCELGRLASEEVREEDAVLIHASCHGRRDRVAGTGYRYEALVALDDAKKEQAIYDWEINERLLEITRRTRHVTVVVDCCHAAGTVRGETGDTVRSLDGIEIPSGPPHGGRKAGLGRRGEPRLQDAFVLAACLESQLAAERTDETGRCHGVLTRALLRALGGLPANELWVATWAGLLPHILQAVEDENPSQNPWTIGERARTALGGLDRGRAPGLDVRLVGGAYRIGAGTLLDVTTGAQIAVYGPEPAVLPELGSPADTRARVGHLVVVREERHGSVGAPLEPGFVLPAEPRGRLVRAGARGRLRAYWDALLELDRTATSDLVERVGDRSKADVWFELTPHGPSIALRDGVFDGAPRTYQGAEVPVDAPDRQAWLGRLIEHYNSYTRPLRLVRNAPDWGGLLRLDVLDANDPSRSEPPRFAGLDPIPSVDGAVRVPIGSRYCFRAENTSPDDLQVTLLECCVDGEVLHLGDAQLPQGTSQLFWAGGRVGLPFVAGAPSGRSRVVAVGTTDLRAALSTLRLPPFAACAPQRSTKDVAPAPAPPHLDRWTGTLLDLDTFESSEGQGRRT